MKRKKLMIWIVCLFCLFAGRPATAWWSLLYPGSVYEAGAQKEEEKEQPVQIRWKLAEWIAQWFSDQ